MNGASPRNSRRTAGLSYLFHRLLFRFARSAAGAALLAIVALTGLAGFAPTASAANPKTFATGTLIVPMDTTYQNLGMFKAYGLVYRLLQSNIPVYWLIADGKTFNGVDFSANTRDHYAPFAVVGNPYTYRGGPFVIDQANVAVADPIITAWRNANGGNPSLAIHETTAPFTFPDIQLVLQSAPRIALEQTNASIAIAYFNAAGIPDQNGSAWNALSPNILSESRIAGCPGGICASSTVGDGALFTGGACSSRAYDVFVTPHNSGYAYSLSNTLDLGTQTYAELDYFVGQGGGWIATCHSILSNENAIVALYNTPSPAVRALFKSPSAGGFLTQAGFTTISNVSGTWTVDPGSAELPIAQAVPTTVANGLPGGSVQNWPSPLGPGSHTGAPAYWPQAERVASFITGAGIQYDTAVNGAYHNGEGQGKMTFLGGHSYSTAVPYSTNFEAPYLRFFYNSLFFNSAAVANMTLQPLVSSIPQGNTTALQIALKNTGGSTALGVGALSPVTVILQPGVTYVSMASGPTPTVVVNGDGTTALTFAAGSIGDVPGGSNAFLINTTASFLTTGAKQIATMAGQYGDQLQEAFTSNSCASVLVVAAPGTAITKSPATAVANVGDVFTWTLSYSNPGAASLLNAYVEDLLPTANFAYVSATPAPTTAVPVGGNTRLRWTIGTIAAGGSGSITLRAVVQTGGGPFTNTATLRGNDAAGNVYTGSGSSAITVNPPSASLVKTVTWPGAPTPASPGTTLTYSLAPFSLGCATAPCPATTSPTLFSNLRIFDPFPANTNTIANISQGGSQGAYIFVAAQQGADPGPDPQTTMDLTYSTASPFTQVLGSTVTVTMALKNLNASSASITVDTASLTPSDGVSTCTLSTALPITINKNTTQNLSFSCTIASTSEITWDGDASGTFNGAGAPAYSFPTATSPSLLGVTTATGSNVVRWTPQTDSNTAPIPQSVAVAGTGPGLFALEGGGSSTVERYDIAANTWANLTNALAATGAGASLVYDGLGYANGYVYALRGGNQSSFYRYKLSNGTAGTWSSLANAPWSVGSGGSLTTLGGLIYALEGNNTAGFASYNPTSNAWTSLANTPTNLQKGSALATDGTYIYATRGNGTNNFYRYNVAANTWSSMANAALKPGDGAGLTSIGTTIYSTQANGTKGFQKFVPNAATGTWTKLANLPNNIGGKNGGGGLTTDGNTIWALAGNNTKTFYAYNVTWSTKANTLANIGQSGALAWTPASAAATRTTDAAASPVLVTGTLANPTTVQVVMTITSGTAVSGITPNLSVVSSQAIPATGPSPAGCTVSPSGAQSIAAGGSLTFTWTCTGVYATNTTQAFSFGSLTFSAGASATTPATTWTAAQANSILITQPLTFTANINNPTTATQIQNQAILSDAAAFSQGVLSNVVTTPVIQPALVTAIKSVTPTGQVTPGTQLTYTIDVQNTTAGTATSLVFTDAIPANSTYVPGSCSVTGGTVNTCNGTGTFNVGTLGPFGSATLTFKVTANTPAAAGNTTTISNTATWTSTAGGSGTTNTVVNTILATPSVTVSKAQSVVPAANGNGFITPGSTITYTLTVSNPAGAVPGTGVTATDLVPAGTTYVAASCTVAGGSVNTCSSSGAAAGSTVTFNIGNLAASATATLTFQVTVNNPAADGDTITNSGQVTADTNIVGQTYTAYSNLVQYPIAAAPVVAVSKAANPASGSDVAVGDVIIYTLTISNTGTANTTSAYVQDAIPLGTTYIANTTCLNGTLTPTPPTPPGTPWTCAGANGVMVPELTPGVPPTAGSLAIYSPGQGSADGGTLVVGSPATVSFAVTVNGTPDNANASGIITNVASAGTASTSPVSSNTTTHTKKTDLSITKTGPDSVASGDAVSYVLVAANSNGSSADGAVVADPAVANFNTIPPQATVSCVTLSGGAVCPVGLTIPQLQAGVAIPTFPKSSSLQITISGFADTNTTVQSIVNTATVTAPAGLVDSNPANNTAGKTTTIGAFPTLALIAGVRGYVDGGKSWFEWETVSEARTAGFNVYRKDAVRGNYVQLNPHLLPALDSDRRGGTYRYVDPAAVAGATYTYSIEEIEITGRVRHYGPYAVTIGAAKASDRMRPLAATKDEAPIAAGFERKVRASGGRVVALADAPTQASTTANATAGSAVSTVVAAANAVSANILVEQDGIYAVPAKDIGTALGKTTVQVKALMGKSLLRLEQKGRAVPWVADSTGNNLMFYGQALQGADAVHTPHNVYVLTQADGVQMTVVSGATPKPASGTPSFTSTIHAERNRLPYPSLATNPDADFWYWDTAYALNTGLGPMVPFEVAAPAATGSGSATIRVALQGASDLVPGNDHHTHVYVNGAEVNVGGGKWDGLGAVTLTGSFNASLLRTDGSANVIHVAEELDAGVPHSVVEVDSIEIDYPRYYKASGDALRLRGAAKSAITVSGFTGSNVAVVNISDPANPQWIAALQVAASGAGSAVTFSAQTGQSQYFAAIPKAPARIVGNAPSSLKSTSNSSSYLVLAPSSLLAGANALASYRKGRVVELKDVYNEFNYGIASPHAIADFIAYAAQNWKPKPKFVALVGKGTIDPKNYLGLNTNAFPVLMTQTPEGLYAADNRYADFTNDGVPDVALGRVPALTNADVTNYLAKVQTYESAARRPANNALVVADNPGQAGNFTANGQAVTQALLADGYTSTPVYLESTTLANARAQIVSTLNSAAGVGIFNYIGHGGTNQLADENLLSNNPGDAQFNALSNASRQPIFMAFSCAVGDGSYPGSDSLSESLIWRQGGGVVAAFAPTGLSDNSQAHILNLGIIGNVAGAGAKPTLGEAAAAAIAEFAKKGGPRYMREIYSVIGDPGLRIRQ